MKTHQWQNFVNFDKLVVTIIVIIKFEREISGIIVTSGVEVIIVNLSSVDFIHDKLYEFSGLSIEGNITDAG